MGREAVDRVDGGTDRNVMAEDADPLRAFDQASTERATSLVARDQHAAFASRQVVAQMVPDAAGVAHSAGGNDDRTRADVVERHRLLDAGGEMEPGKVPPARVPVCKRPGLPIEDRKSTRLNSSH